EGPALSSVEGPALSDVEGPALSGVEGPALSGVEGPARAVAEPGGQRVERQQHHRAIHHPSRVVDHDQRQARPARHVPQRQMKQKHRCASVRFGGIGETKQPGALEPLAHLRHIGVAVLRVEDQSGEVRAIRRHRPGDEVG
nr:hypothetical protein [Anaerolineae bacterium]